jgi:hypothetical protein
VVLVEDSVDEEVMFIVVVEGGVGSGVCGGVKSGLWVVR